MLIKSLRMKNFRQFAGDTYVEFSTDPEKNVTIILGNNTFGKTTLLQAFNWCFYQNVLFSDNPDDLLNYEVASKLFNNDETEVVVEIVLIHDGFDYKITRTQRVRKSGNGYSKQTEAKIIYSQKEENGKTVTKTASDQKQIKNIINTILPEELSKYFFFDTERVNSISTKKDVADAVKGLMGLNALDNAKKHIGSKGAKTTVLGMLYGEFDLQGNRDAEATLQAIHNLSEKRKELKENIRQYDSEIRHYEQRKEQLETILRENQTTAALQSKKSSLEKNVASEMSAQSDIIKSFYNDFNDGFLRYFSIPLLSQAEEFLKAAEVDDKGIKDLTQAILQEIINRGKCICGCELKDENDAIQHIRQEMKFVPPESIGTTIATYIDRLKTFSCDPDKFTQKMTTLYSTLYRSKNRVIEWNTEIEEISDAIKGKENVREYELELVDVKQRIKDFHSKKEKANREDAFAEKDIESKQKLYDSLIAKSAKNTEIMQYIKYAEDLVEWMKATYDEKESTIREQLEIKVNDIFEKMYHGKRRVVIDNRFAVELLTLVSDREINTGKSEGLDRVKNFAFIGGLVALAKDKILTAAGDGDIDIASEPYPLVMDAPFSNADEEHTGNISRVLPEVAEQVIMFVMEKDFKIAEPMMKAHIGKQFRLDKHSETHTVLK